MSDETRELDSQKLVDEFVDNMFSGGIIMYEVKLVLVKVAPIQTCGDWAVLFFAELTHNNNNFSNIQRK